MEKIQALAMSLANAGASIADGAVVILVTERKPNVPALGQEGSLDLAMASSGGIKTEDQFKTLLTTVLNKLNGPKGDA